MESKMGIERKTRAILTSFCLVVFLSLEVGLTLTAAQQTQSGCPCNTIGTANLTSCDNTTTQCSCKSGYDGPQCINCLAGFYRTDLTTECQSCMCDEFGSLGKHCDRTGECSCKPGVGGSKCNRCLDKSHWWNGKQCQPCNCTEVSTQCNGTNANVGSKMCNTCTKSANFTSTCSNSCSEYYKYENGTCLLCQSCEMHDRNATAAANTTQHTLPECQRFLEKCLKSCQHISTTQTTECSVCNTLSLSWNCTKIAPSSEQPTQKGNNILQDYYIYAAAGGGAVLFVAIISTTFYIKRKRKYQKPMMPLWTIELKHDDQVSFTDYNDVDVMYLDDSYLMEPSEVFTTSTDSMDERIGYHTLS